MSLRWYVVQTKPLAEAVVCEAIHDLPGEYTPLLPVCHEDEEPRAGRRPKVVPRFPGYVLVSFDDELFGWSCIRYLRGVERLLGGCSANDWHPTALPRGYVDELIIRQEVFRGRPAGPRIDRHFKQGDLLYARIGLAEMAVVVDADRGEKIAVWIDMMGGRRRTIINRESLVGAPN